MRILFIITLVLNFLVETLAATSLIGGPEGITAVGLGGQWSMHYGFAALAIASASVWIWPSRHNLEAVTPVLGILLTFHLGLLLSLTVAGDQMAGVIMHSVLVFLIVLLFVRRKKWCGIEDSST